MKKVLFLPLLLFLLVLLLLADGGSPAAARLRVLDDAGKKPPGTPAHAASRLPAAGSSEPVILGRHHTIAHVKARPGGRHTASSQWLPDVGRRITAKSAIIIDADTGESLYELASDMPRQPASTIKVLTAMIALKSLDMADWVQVSGRAAGMPRSKIYLDPRKSYRANDLINAVLLASANDASVALAEKIAGSEEEFAEMMTLRAHLWGAGNTVCRTASGLTASGQQSTARDLATIFRHAMQDRDFADRMRRTKIRASYGKLLRNHNKALWRIDGAEGGKTGYTRAARQTYVGQFSQGDKRIIVALMGSETMWTDIEHLVNYGFTRQDRLHFARKELERKGKRVALARE